MNKIPRVRVPVYAAQKEMVRDAVENGQLASGPHLRLLEDRLCAEFGKRFAVLTANGFSALLTALKAVGKEADLVATSPISTCFAVTNAIRAADMTPYFIDVESDTASVGTISGSHDLQGAVVPDHFGIIAGACRNWTGHESFLIEDAAQAFFSRSQVATKADAVVLSFYPTKVINGIDGGAILTDNASLFDAARRLTQYDDQIAFSDEPRLNLKMANVHAAFALGTLEHISEIRARLVDIYSEFVQAFDAAGIVHLAARSNEVPWRVLIVADSAEEKNRVRNHLEAAGVQTADELLPLCPPQDVGKYPLAAALLQRSFSIPYHAGLSDDDVSAVASAISSL